MLKITTDATAGEPALRLEGRLTSPWVAELDRWWQEIVGTDSIPVLVDLTGVTFIGSEGKALLTRMWQHGVKFHTAGCLNTSILEEIMQIRKPNGSDRSNQP